MTFSRLPLWLCLFLLLPLTACTSTRMVESDTAQATYEQINRRAAQQTARVVLVTGREVRAEVLTVRADSTTWQRENEDETRVTETVATSMLREVRFVNRTRAGILGSVLGAGAGVGIGLGTTTGDDSEGYSRAIWLGLGLGALGYAVGAYNGVQRVYRFPIQR